MTTSYQHMLLEWDHDRILLNQRPLEARRTFYLLPDRDQQYVRTEDIRGLREDKQYLCVDGERGQFLIHTSWHGEYPLFYHAGKNYFAVSSSLPDLLENLSLSCGLHLKLDKIAVFESLIFDHPLRARTLFDGIKQIPGRKQVTFDFRQGTLSIESTAPLIYDQGISTPNEKSLLADAVDVLSDLLDTSQISDGSIVVPLSGGLDSRLISCLLHKHHIPFEAVTFGPNGGMEPYVAQQVAERLGIDIRYLELKHEYYKPYGDEATWLTGGMSNHRHTPLYSTLAANHITADLIFHGFLGDQYAGKMMPEASSHYAWTRSQSFESFLANRVTKAYVWSRLSASEKDIILAELNEVMEENLRINLPCHMEAYFHHLERQYSLTANVFTPIERFGKILRPFAKKSYFEFFNPLPYRLRYKRKLFREAGAVLFPEIFNLGTHNQIFRADSTAGKLEQWGAWTMAKISFASQWITQGRVVIQNPKNTEPNREVLHTALKQDYDLALKYAGEILGKDFRGLQGIRIENRRDIRAQFRVLSFYVIMRQLREHGISVEI